MVTNHNFSIFSPYYFRSLVLHFLGKLLLNKKSQIDTVSDKPLFRVGQCYTLYILSLVL